MAESAEERATTPLKNVVLTLEEATREPLPTEPPPGGLRLALLGRTKAGKSQLTAVLTGDIEGRAIGIGRQRTTRKSSAYQLDQFELVDTPGVAALDGEKDTERALKAADQADAVLWVYAESLQQEEADQLEALLRAGKPVVVAYNAKSSVDRESRRGIFTRTPEWVFKNLEGHETRIKQIAERAGTNAPMFIPVHARAAWWAMKTDDDALRKASRIDELTAACEKVLVARAEALRVQRQHDAVRKRLDEYSAAAALTAELLEASPDVLLAEFNAEAAKLRQSADGVAAASAARIDADIAKVRAALPQWVAKVDPRTADEAWNDLLEKHHVFRALDEFGADIAEESSRHGTLFQAAAALRDRFELRRRPADKPKRGLFGALKSLATVAVKGAVRFAKSFAVGRGVAKVFAKLLGRAAPGVGWALVVTDGLEAFSHELRAELQARKVEVAAWERDARAVYERELDSVRGLLHQRLEKAREHFVRSVEEHYRSARRVLAEIPHLRTRAEELSERGGQAVEASDRELVVALAHTQDVNVEVTHVERTPGLLLTVHLPPGVDAGRVEQTLRPLLLNEKIVVRTSQARTKEHA